MFQLVRIRLINIFVEACFSELVDQIVEFNANAFGDVLGVVTEAYKAVFRDGFKVFDDEHGHILNFVKVDEVEAFSELRVAL